MQILFAVNQVDFEYLLDIVLKYIRSLHVCVLRSVRLFVIRWIVVCHAPLSMRFSRQEYWRGLPFPPPGDPLDPGIKPVSPEFLVLAGGILYHWAKLESPGSNPSLYIRSITSIIKMTQEVCLM